MIPHRTPFFLPLLYPSLTWRMSPTRNDIYLTFDDGPIPGPTEFVLETLARFNVQATFFCIGDNIQKHPNIFGKLLEAGHRTGNHTHNHINGWTSSVQAYVENVNRCSATMHSFIPGINPALFRPPYGRITHKQISSLHSYKIIMWDVLAKDYSKSLSGERSLRGTFAATRNGSIVVFHDSLKAERNLTYVLPRYIEKCLEAGYSFKLLN